MHPNNWGLDPDSTLNEAYHGYKQDSDGTRTVPDTDEKLKNLSSQLVVQIRRLEVPKPC